MVSQRTSDRTFLGAVGLLFIASAALTAIWCRSMSDMGSMPMPGAWTMSMIWMRAPGQTWIGSIASLLAMWVVMMGAMMLPTLTPMLGRYRDAVGGSRCDSHLGRLTVLVGLGYFFVWTVFGVAVLPLGVGLATVEMKQPALARGVPLAIGWVILIAGALQFTRWKAHLLAYCRAAPPRSCTLSADAATAWRQGVRFGLYCLLSCANLTAILLLVGMMDLRSMVLVTAAINAERLAPAGERVAHAIGAIIVLAALLLITRAAGLR